MSDTAPDQITSAVAPPFHLVEMVAELVGVYVAHNSVPPAELPGLLAAVHATLSSLGHPAPAPGAEAKPTPPVSVRKSIAADYLVSMEDGKHYKSLRRHLSTRGLTPEAYRAKWGLPADYPMVAPSYSDARSKLAKEMGLGALRRKR